MLKNKKLLIWKKKLILQEGDRFLQAAHASEFWPTGRGIFHDNEKKVWLRESYFSMFNKTENYIFYLFRLNYNYGFKSYGFICGLSSTVFRKKCVIVKTLSTLYTLLKVLHQKIKKVKKNLKFTWFSCKNRYF